MKSHFKSLVYCALALALTTAYQACGGGFYPLATITGTQTGASVSDPVSDPLIADVNGKTCEKPNDRGLAETSSRRLTKTEILNSFNDLFGVTNMTKPAVMAAALAIPDDSTAHEKSQFDPILQESHITAVLGVAEAAEVAARTFRQDIYGGCVNAVPVTKACFTTFVTNFGKRAWRRPLTTAEVESFATSFWVAGSTKSFEDAASALLISPEFLLLLESRASGGARKRLSSYEVAARISFLTLGTIPDGTLLAAADKGELATLQQVRAQVDRLLSTRGKDGVIRSVVRYVGGENISDPSSIAGIAQGLPNSGSTVGLGSELKQELMDFISYVIIEKNGSYNDLMTSAAVFPKTARLAAIYKTGVWTPGQPPPNAPTGERAGLWTRAALLATTNSHTKPFSRGVNFRKRILCQSLPSPDPNVIASREDLIQSLSPLMYSNREIHTRITDSASCMGCHSRINPVGFGLEGFNELGGFRTTELVLGTRGETLATHPVDTRVDLQLTSAPAVPVSNIETFMKTLTINSQAKSCFAETLYQERRLRDVAASDNCALANLETELNANKPLLTVLADSIANEDIFWNGSK